MGQSIATIVPGQGYHAPLQLSAAEQTRRTSFFCNNHPLTCVIQQNHPAIKPYRSNGIGPHRCIAAIPPPPLAEGRHNV